MKLLALFILRIHIYNQMPWASIQSIYSMPCICVVIQVIKHLNVFCYKLVTDIIILQRVILEMIPKDLMAMNLLCYQAYTCSGWPVADFWKEYSIGIFLLIYVELNIT